MTTIDALHPATDDRTDRSARSARRLLAAAVAGPAFVAVSFAQVPFRHDFDLSRHAFSFLLNGPGSWIQTLNFLVLGGSYLATATGLRAVIAGRRGGVAAALTGVLGAGQVIAGLFAPAGAYGYPPGAPSGRPDDLDASSVVHGLAFGLSLLSWIALLVVLATVLRLQHRSWAVASAVTAAALLVVAGASGHPNAAAVIYLVVTPAFAVTSALLLHLRTLGRVGDGLG